MHRKDSMMRTPSTLALAALLSLTLLVAPAAANAPKGSKPPPPVFTYTATIDGGQGPVVVSSTDDLFAPLVDLATGRQYLPVAWDVKVGDQEITATRPGKLPKHTVDCSYDDGTAVGTVTVDASHGHHYGWAKQDASS
jgi:hypothetical protein